MKFKNWCLRLFERFGIGQRRYRVLFADELPDDISPFELHAIGRGQPWLAAFKCPCGCGSIIQLSLLTYDSPRWALNVENDGTGTLSPSVWRSQGCRSHFFVKRGMIIWCGNTPNHRRQESAAFPRSVACAHEASGRFAPLSRPPIEEQDHVST